MNRPIAHSIHMTPAHPGTLLASETALNSAGATGCLIRQTTRPLRTTVNETVGYSRGTGGTTRVGNARNNRYRRTYRRSPGHPRCNPAITKTSPLEATNRHDSYPPGARTRRHPSGCAAEVSRSSVAMNRQVVLANDVRAGSAATGRRIPTPPACGFANPNPPLAASRTQKRPPENPTSPRRTHPLIRKPPSQPRRPRKHPHQRQLRRRINT